MNTKISILLLSFVIGVSAFTNPVSAQYAVPSCNGAVLNGYVITFGYPTNAQFEWGEGSSISWSTPVQTFSEDSQYSQLLNNLSPDSTYSFRTRVWNENGTNISDALTFTTASCNTPTPAQTAKVQSCSVNVNPSSVQAGGQATWTVTSVDSDGKQNNRAFTWTGTDNGTSIGTKPGGMTPWQDTYTYNNASTYERTANFENGVSCSRSFQVTSPAQQPQVLQPTVTITADNNNLSYNTGTIVRWTSTNATSCSASAGANGWSGSKNLSGSSPTGNLTSTTNFIITCINGAGSASNLVTINVSGQQQQTPQPTVTLTADNANLAYNGATTLRWSSTNATSCSAGGGTNGWAGSRNTSSTFSTGNLTSTVTYNITCINSVGSDTKSVTVNVGGQNNNNNQQSPTVNIWTDDTSINYNSSTVVRWTSNNANSCSASGGANGWSGSKNLSGSFNTGNLSGSVTFSINCSNNSGSNSDSITINVNGQNNNNNNQNLNVDIWADNTSVNYNSNTFVRWTSNGANSCTATGGTNGWSGSRNTSGSFNTGNLTDRVTYTITCYNNGSSDSDSITINVSGQSSSTIGQPSVYLTADQYTVGFNGDTVLRWTSSNASSCFASGGTGNWLGSRGTSGSFNTGPLTRTVTYYISCTNNAGSAFDSVMVTVLGQSVVYQTSQTVYTPPAPTSMVSLASAIETIGCACQNVASNSGSELLYTVTYRNTSNSTARNMNLQVTLPPDAIFVSAAPYNPSVSGNTVTFNLSNLAPNSQGAVMVRARARDGLVNGANMTFISNLTHTNPSGQRLAVSDNVSTQVWGSGYMANADQNQNFYDGNVTTNVAGAVSSLGGILTTGVVGWLLLVVLVLLIIILVKHLLTQNQKRTIITTTP